jgi:hypothetical protein
MPHCEHVVSLSPEWVEEKLLCINPTELQNHNEIMELFQNKFNAREHFLTPDEFTRILKWKGLAKSVDKFLRRYVNTNEVQNKTKSIFESGLNNYTFEDTNDHLTREEILQRASAVINTLDELKYIGTAVASAALRLAFPNLFGTVDYIVPGLLHCIEDDLGHGNPFRGNLQDIDRLQGCLLLPNGNRMTPTQARQLASNNYREYIQELWNIKREFGLNDKVADIEMSLWSYGICYVKKQNIQNRQDTLPFRFQANPNPPRSGSFSKNCPN